MKSNPKSRRPSATPPLGADLLSRIARDPAKRAAGMAAFFRAMSLWKATSAEARRILGSPSQRRFRNWQAGTIGPVPPDTIRRISYVLGIFEALQILYSDEALADSWPRRPNRAFDDRAPLQRMSEGGVSGLHAVRRCLDRVRNNVAGDESGRE